MSTELDLDDLSHILFALQELKRKFETFEDAPDENYRLNRIAEVDRVLRKVKVLRAEMT